MVPNSSAGVAPWIPPAAFCRRRSSSRSGCGLGEEEDRYIAHRVLLNFPWRGSYAKVQIFRAFGTPVNFQLLDEVAPTVNDPSPSSYVDSLVQPLPPSFYRVRAIGHDGGRTRMSRTVRRPGSITPILSR